MVGVTCSNPVPPTTEWPRHRRFRDSDGPGPRAGFFVCARCVHGQERSSARHHGARPGARHSGGPDAAVRDAGIPPPCPPPKTSVAFRSVPRAMADRGPGVGTACPGNASSVSHPCTSIACRCRRRGICRRRAGCACAHRTPRRASARGQPAAHVARSGEAAPPRRQPSVASLMRRIWSRSRPASSNSRSRACWYICCSSVLSRAASFSGAIAA